MTTTPTLGQLRRMANKTAGACAAHMAVVTVSRKHFPRADKAGAVMTGAALGLLHEAEGDNGRKYAIDFLLETEKAIIKEAEDDDVIMRASNKIKPSGQAH